MNRLRQRWMLSHRLHPQALHADRLVLTNQARREFVQEILAAVGNASMNARDLCTSFLPVLRTPFLFGQTSLGFGQLLLILVEEARIAYLFAPVEHYHVM